MLKSVKTRLGQRTSQQIVVVTTGRYGFRHPILVQFSSAALFITLDGRYDGSLRAQRSVEGLHSKTLELLKYGYWATSLIFMTNLQDGPSFIRRSVMLSITPHFVKIPHLFSAVALGCHLRTATRSVGGLFCISSLKNLRIHLSTDFLQIRRNLYKN